MRGRAELMRMMTNHVQVDRDVMDIGRRIREGDELWRGDPNMTLTVDPETGVFEVWSVDGMGNEYVAAQAMTCDARLLVQLAENDWRRGSRTILANMAAKQAKIESDRQSARDDMHGQMAEKMAWALRRCLAGHLGGRQVTYSFNKG